MTRQYYFKDNKCQTQSAGDKDCICWHDEGTGPYEDPIFDRSKLLWREKPNFTKDERHMINEQAANAFRTARFLTALYTRLDVARDAITVAMDNLPKDFDINQTKRINEIRNILSREMSGIWDLRESEERRSCSQLPPIDEFEQRQQHAIEWMFSPQAGILTGAEARAAIRDLFGEDVDEALRKKFTPAVESIPATPDSSPAEVLDFSFGPVQDHNARVFPPDPTFMQVHSLI